MGWRSISAMAALLAATGLAGCAGGGGGGPVAPTITTTSASPPPAPPPAPTFASWSSTAYPSEAVLGGAALTVTKSNFSSHDWLAGGPSPVTVTFSLTQAKAASGVWIIDLSANNLIAAATGGAADAYYRDISIANGAGSVLIKQLATLDIEDLASNPIYYADPATSNFNYQTFGWWYANNGGLTQQRYGAFSVGAATPDAALPQTGTAVFTGTLGGQGIDTSSGLGVFGAAVTLNADFAARTVGFSSLDFRDTTKVYAGTALSGTLSYPGQQNSLTGTLTTASGLYSGPVTGRFYGPSAQEIGGAFVLAPTSTNEVGRIVGGFGAVR